MVKAHAIQNYPGLPAVKGVDLAKAMQDHLKAMDIEITEKQVTAVYAMGDYYGIQTPDEMYEATAVILATGVVMSKTFPGEDELLGRGVSYCATCDALLYRGKKTVVIASSPKEEAEAEFLAEVAAEVIYIPTYREETHLSDRVKVLRAVPTAIEGGFKAQRLVLGEEKLETDGIFILRESISPAQLVPGLQMDGNHAAVTRRMETNLPGLFACGDIAGMPYQYIKAAGEGNTAALSAAAYLDQMKKAAKA
jgi:thioredoxin reductase (NADPH)